MMEEFEGEEELPLRCLFYSFDGIVELTPSPVWPHSIRERKNASACLFLPATYFFVWNLAHVVLGNARAKHEANVS